MVRCPNASQRAPRARLGIPRIVHFVYGLEPNASFSWTSFVAVRSALAVHRPSTAFFHYSFEPPGAWFGAGRARVRTRRDADRGALARFGFLSAR